MRYSNPPKATSRPCLPSVEQLDDRVLLSAAVVGQTGGDGGDSNGGGVAGEPTAVERDFTSLLDAELAALKLAGDAQEKVSPIVIKLGQEFFKIDSLLLTSLIKGELPGNQDLSQKLDAEFAKVRTTLDRLGDAGLKILPAVQKVREAATSLVRDLGAAGDGAFAGGALLPDNGGDVILGDAASNWLKF